MITQEENPKLYAYIKNKTDLYLKWLREVGQAEEMYKLLPAAVKKMDITSIDVCWGELSLEIDGNVQTVKNLIAAGGENFDLHLTFWSETCRSEGKLPLSDGTKASVRVSNLPKPADCRIVETSRVVTEKALVCNTTEGEPGIAALLRSE